MSDRDTNSEQDFELLHELKTPEPFDRAVAYLEMRSESNHLSNGMDLSVSASFGAEQIEIPLSDGEVLTVNCEIYEAIIITEKFNCLSDDILPVQSTRGFQFTHRVSGDDKENRTNDGGLGFAASGEMGYADSAVTSFNGKFEKHSAKSQNCMQSFEAEQTSSQIEYDVDQIRIYKNPTASPLAGKLVDGQKCWRIVPIDRTRPYGILARLQVRKGWMKLSEPEATSTSLQRLLSKVWGKNSPAADFHKEAFIKLIEHLVEKGLQTKKSNLNAVLAARAVVAAPLEKSDLDRALAVPNYSRAFQVPVRDLELTLNGTKMQVKSVLAAHGVEGYEADGSDTPSDELIEGLSISCDPTNEPENFDRCVHLFPQFVSSFRLDEFRNAVPSSEKVVQNKSDKSFPHVSNFVKEAMVACSKFASAANLSRAMFYIYPLRTHTCKLFVEPSNECKMIFDLISIYILLIYKKVDEFQIIERDGRVYVTFYHGFKEMRNHDVITYGKIVEFMQHILKSPQNIVSNSSGNSSGLHSIFTEIELDLFLIRDNISK